MEVGQGQNLGCNAKGKKKKKLMCLFETYFKIRYILTLAFVLTWRKLVCDIYGSDLQISWEKCVNKQTMEGRSSQSDPESERGDLGST
jgi:hypothetical protein